MSMHKDDFIDACDKPSPLEPVNYSIWMIRLFTWDGAMPLIMLSLPGLARRFGPKNNDQFLVMAVVAALIAGILLRFTFGMRHINSNHCGPIFKTVQRIVLLLMIFVLVLIESVICVNPPGRLQQADVLFFGIAGSLYLLVMAFVLYPGRRRAERSACNE